MTEAEKLSQKLGRKDTPTKIDGRKIVWRCNLVEMRTKLRLTVKDVASAVGITASVVSNSERGTDLNLDNARKLADFFGVTVEQMWPERIDGSGGGTE